MAPRAKKLKIHPDRTNTAAYAASQPLFSALRNAITTLDTTKANLIVARDIVQSLHVKIANDDQNNDPSRHDAYMAAAVNAWISSTDTFCEIFEELVNVTGADPSEGRDAGVRHDEFVSILETTRRARGQAKQSSSTNRENGGDGVVPDEEQDESVGEETENNEKEPEPVPYVIQEGKRRMAESENDTQQQKGSQRSSMISADVRYSKTGDKILWQKEELKVPYKSLDPDEKKAWNVIASRKKHAVRIKKRKQAKSNAQATSGASNTNATANGMSAEQPAFKPEIEFEDVSAEVEARLKAKAEKRAAAIAKKAEKKRKRESGDSLVNGTKEGTLEPLEALEQSLAEKPARKKAKKGVNNETAPQVNGSIATASTTTAKKRKDAEPAVADGAETNSFRTKRKKTKN